MGGEAGYYCLFKVRGIYFLKLHAAFRFFWSFQQRCSGSGVFFIFLYIKGSGGYGPRVFQQGNDSFQL